MSAIRGLHYKVRKLFLIEQRNREFNEFKEVKESKEFSTNTNFSNIPNFSKFPKLLTI